MKPEEKANQLFSEFKEFVKNFLYIQDDSIVKRLVKEMVFIIIEEIISEINMSHKYDWIKERKDGEETVSYWLEVKREFTKIYNHGHIL